MGVHRPYFRTIRQSADGSYGGQWRMVQHPAYCERPDLLTRSFLILQEEVKDYFRFVEPADENLGAFSLKGAELLVRLSVEVEASLKGILRSNGYGNGSRLTMKQYRYVEESHYLSSYRVQIPLWTGDRSVRRPFEAWSRERGKLPWYGAYNSIKHDRTALREHATLANVIDAWTGLAALLAAQFLNEDFMPGGVGLEVGRPFGREDGFETSIGDFLAIQLPTSVPEEDRYDFNWADIEDLPDPFLSFDYHSVASKTSPSTAAESDKDIGE